MADRAEFATPYAQAQRLIDWARENWADVDGRCVLAGIDIEKLPIGRALNVLTAMAVDDAMPVLSVETRKRVEVYDRRRVRGEVLAELRGKDTEVPTGGGQVPTVRRQAASREWDRETWGLLPEHQAGTRAAMAFAAGLGG